MNPQRKPFKRFPTLHAVFPTRLKPGVNEMHRAYLRQSHEAFSTTVLICVADVSIGLIREWTGGSQSQSIELWMQAPEVLLGENADCR